MSHLQRAAAIALASGDYERACWAQLWLLIVVSDHSGPDATVSLLAELRANTVRSADPVILAALHIFVAQMEAKRGLLSSAHRHIRLALDLLQSMSNAWLEALAEHIEVAIATMRADFTGALERLHTRSNSHHDRAPNICLRQPKAISRNLLFLTGDYESALQHQARAFEAFPRHSDNYIASLDNRPFASNSLRINWTNAMIFPGRRLSTNFAL